MRKRQSGNAGRGSRGTKLLESLECRTMFAVHPLGELPVLNSYPDGRATLFLDFDGSPQMQWGAGTMAAMPAYDNDGDATTFEDAELADIRSIWGIVAEKYSPFNINVTTADPGTYPVGQTLRVVIAGQTATVTGFASLGGFTGGETTVWVFAKGQSPAGVAKVAAHEAGHALGLEHQSLYDSAGTKLVEYHPGDSFRGPIMGSPNLYNARALWWYGPNADSATTIQDDMAIIAGSINGFGYRPDDHGDLTAGATALAASGDALSGRGVIATSSDSDVFMITTGGGAVSFTASAWDDAAVYGPQGMLDLQLRLVDAEGRIVAAADTSSLGEAVSVILAAGTYYLVVASHGAYADVGQYTVTGTAPVATPVPPQPPPPAGSPTPSC